MQYLGNLFWKTILLCCAFTGLMQLPLAFRYGISTIPTLEWTALPIIVYQNHILFASCFLFLIAYKAVKAYPERKTFSKYKKIRAVFIVLIACTGISLMINNLNGYSLPPLIARVAVLTHLTFFIVWTVTAFIHFILTTKKHIRKSKTTR